MRGRSKYRLAERAATVMNRPREVVEGSLAFQAHRGQALDRVPRGAGRGLEVGLHRPGSCSLDRRSSRAKSSVQRLRVFTLVKISASDSPVSSGASVASNRFSRLWRHSTGHSVIGEPGQIPAMTLDDRLNGAALDLECLRRCSHVVSVPWELDPGCMLEGQRTVPLGDFKSYADCRTT